MRVSFCFHLGLTGNPSPTNRPKQTGVFWRTRQFLTDKLLAKTEWERRVGLPSLPILPLQACREGPYSVLLSADSEEVLRSLQLDVLVNFTNHILRGAILSIPKYGVWSYHHGDPREFRGYPPVFWEIYHDAPTTGAILQKLEHRLDDGVVLRKTTFPTIRHSYYRQRETLFSISIPWLAEVARDAAAGMLPAMDKLEEDPVGPIYTKSTHSEFFRFLAILLRNKLGRLSGR